MLCVVSAKGFDLWIESLQSWAVCASPESKVIKKRWESFHKVQPWSLHDPSVLLGQTWRNEALSAVCFFVCFSRSYITDEQKNFQDPFFLLSLWALFVTATALQLSLFSSNSHAKRLQRGRINIKPTWLESPCCPRYFLKHPKLRRTMFLRFERVHANTKCTLIFSYKLDSHSVFPSSAASHLSSTHSFTPPLGWGSLFH